MLQLLGLNIDDPVVRAFLTEVGGDYQHEDPQEDLADRRYVTSHDSGLELATNDAGIVQIVYAHLNGHESKPPYTGALPLGLAQTMTQTEARALLGAPQFSRPAGEIRPLGRYGPMDRYDYAGYSVHLQYAEGTSILVLVTTMQTVAIPGRKREVPMSLGISALAAPHNKALHQTGRGGVAHFVRRGPVVEARPAGEGRCWAGGGGNRQLVAKR